ncbi:MAG: RNA 2',3'-cyclic phosphodiesterase [Rhodobacteraceae bacterium]|nr:RNA 2',3'-cyclic phosphodiesterase [Paracoccaceae bacterium]
MLRLFVGLAIPEAIRTDLGRLCSGLPGARWVDPENFHITLRFIGEVDEDIAREIDHELARITAPAFELSLAGVGTFGQGFKARALWAGVEADPVLNLLQGRVESAVMRAGQPREPRKFMPHVTLARFKHGPSAVPAERLQQFIMGNNLYRAGPFSVDAFILFESQMGKGGPVYHELASYPLGDGYGEMAEWEDA